MESKTFKVKYVTGPTNFNNRPGQFVFYGNNKVKIILDAHKDDPGLVLFDINVSESEVIVDPPLSGRAAEIPQVLLKVSGKQYEFLSGDGSFMGNTGKINDALKASGAQFPSGFKGARKLTPSKTNKFVVYSTYLAVFIVIVILIYFFIKK